MASRDVTAVLYLDVFCIRYQKIRRSFQPILFNPEHESNAPFLQKRGLTLKIFNNVRIDALFVLSVVLYSCPHVILKFLYISGLVPDLNKRSLSRMDIQFVFLGSFDLDTILAAMKSLSTCGVLVAVGQLFLLSNFADHNEKSRYFFTLSSSEQGGSLRFIPLSLQLQFKGGSKEIQRCSQIQYPVRSAIGL